MARDTTRFALDSAANKLASFASLARDCRLDRFTELIVSLNVTAAEGSRTYDFYVITGDGSSEWDLVHFPQLIAAGAARFTARIQSIQLPQAVTAGAPGVATVAPAIINTLTTNAPKTLAAGVVAHGPWGNMLRYELVVGGGALTTGITYTLQVQARE